MPYPPSEDSYLLSEEVKKYLLLLNDKNKKDLKILDMGSGSGIQALTCLDLGISKNNIIAADIEKDSLNFLKKKGLNAVHSDLFSNISGKFNLIIFNAPYLPEDKYDKKPDTTAGKKGNEIILRFLKEAKLYLEENGAILLLFSSLSKPEEILKFALKQGYKSSLLAQKNMGMMESLFVYKFEKN